MDLPEATNCGVGDEESYTDYEVVNAVGGDPEDEGGGRGTREGEDEDWEDAEGHLCGNIGEEADDAEGVDVPHAIIFGHGSHLRVQGF